MNSMDRLSGTDPSEEPAMGAEMLARMVGVTKAVQRFKCVALDPDLSPRC